MPLVLRLKARSTIPLEVDTVQLETVREQSTVAAARTLIQYGNAQAPLGDFFGVTGSAGDNEIIWEGDCSAVKLIGAGQKEGRIRVEGDAGMHLGAQMLGGQILVNGNAGDWVGAEMHGGRIHVRGNAGNLVGAVYRGGRRGMTGGEILVDGSAGSEVGYTMRRGLIAIGGDAGEGVGFNMIAGTILVFGASGPRPAPACAAARSVSSERRPPAPHVPTRHDLQSRLSSVLFAAAAGNGLFRPRRLPGGRLSSVLRRSSPTRQRRNSRAENRLSRFVKSSHPIEKFK